MNNPVIVPDAVESFINSLDFSSSITLVEPILGSLTTKITVENVFFARPNLTVFVDSVPLTVLSVDYFEKTIVVTSEFSEATEFRMNPPFFFHGTPYATNAHISRLKDDEKVPMIYLLEIIRETLPDSTDTALATTADLRLFFLDVANFEDWSTDQHYNRVILPLRNMVEVFVNEARQSPVFGDFDTLQLITHIKFGVYQNNKGHLNSLFNDRLSGLELRGDFPFRKCDCN